MWRNHDHDLVDVQLTTSATGATTSAGSAASGAKQTGSTTTARLPRWVRQGALVAGLAATLLTSSATGGAAAQAAPTATTVTTSGATVTSETIHTTANHPWLTSDRGWQLAGALRIGEPVRLLDGATATVVALHALPGAGPMWDLSLDATHTFAVGRHRRWSTTCQWLN